MEFRSGIWWSSGKEKCSLNPSTLKEGNLSHYKAEEEERPEAEEEERPAAPGRQEATVLNMSGNLKLHQIGCQEQ